MGHERGHSLPKTSRWNSIVARLTDLDVNATQVDAIAAATLDQVRNRYKAIDADAGVNAAFEFLVRLAISARATNMTGALAEQGIRNVSEPTPLTLALALTKWQETSLESREYGELARAAACDAITKWFRSESLQTGPLFTTEPAPADVWKNVGHGTGFCELARLFFSHFTERHLRYFLDREASAVIPTIERRDQLSQRLTDHIDAISQHTFETAHITQSFAAGWFNRHASTNAPSPSEIRSFLAFSFGKLREELRREGTT